MATSSQAARTTTPGNSTELSQLLQKLLKKAWASSPQRRGQGRALICETASRLHRGLRKVAHGFLRTSPGLAAGSLPAMDATLRHPTRISPSPMQMPASPLHDRRAKADEVMGLVQITWLKVLEPPLTGKVTLGTDPWSGSRERRWRPPSRGGGSQEVCVT